VPCQDSLWLWRFTGKVLSIIKVLRMARPGPPSVSLVECIPGEEYSVLGTRGPQRCSFRASLALGRPRLRLLKSFSTPLTLGS
jgi:hypothetical protein